MCFLMYEDLSRNVVFCLKIWHLVNYIKLPVIELATYLSLTSNISPCYMTSSLHFKQLRHSNKSTCPCHLIALSHSTTTLVKGAKRCVHAIHTWYNYSNIFLQNYTQGQINHFIPFCDYLCLAFCRIYNSYNKINDILHNSQPIYYQLNKFSRFA